MREHQGFTQNLERFLIKLNGKPILIMQFNFSPEIKTREKTHNSFIPAGKQLPIQDLKEKKKIKKKKKKSETEKYLELNLNHAFL